VRRREGGFTFVELLLALAVGAIVVAGLYRAFDTLHKWWISSSTTAAQRQGARAGLETVTRDLEMAGFHTTNYGDPYKTGIAITLAAAGEIEVDQQRPRDETIADAAPVFEPRLVYYHLATDLRTGRQNLYRQTRTEPGVPAPDELVVENVGAFSLAYYDRDGNPVAGLPPASPSGSAAYVPGVAVLPGSPLRAIRRIDVALTTVPARAAAFGPSLRDYTLTASVMPQSLAAADEVVLDTTPPAVPTGLEVVDSRSCGAKLRVRWNANAEPDLDGYVVFYGPTGHLTVPVRALGSPGSPEITLNPAGLLITKNADRSTDPNTYAIQVAAYDSSGNHSARSAPVSGNPDPDVTTFGGVADTTVNPVKPSPPTGLTVTEGAADGELVLSWSPPADGTATVGYRVYRSGTPFGDGHVDDDLRVASEVDLTPAVTTWTDRNLEGCSTYHYAVASVNCDETLVALYQHDAASPSSGDYAVASGAPRDSVPPPPPSLAGSVPGEERLLVTLENPLASESPDFARTEIFWSSSPHPPPWLDPVTGTVSGGEHIPDSDGGSPGVFTRRGSQVIVFDDENYSSPTLNALKPGETYHLMAVSYDGCGNASTPDGIDLVVLPTPAGCEDEPPGPPGPFFTGAAATSCEPETTVLRWEYPGVETVADLAGFRIERTGPGGTFPLTAGPTMSRSWTDAGPLEAGGEYTYTVAATDCVWESWLALSGPLPYGEPLSEAAIGPVYPGGLRRFASQPGGDELAPENFVTTVSDVPGTYTHHNNVRLALQNTSRSPVTVRQMAVTWERPGLVLDRVVVGGSPSGTTPRTIDLGGVPSGTRFSVDASIRDVADGIGEASGPVPLLLRFTAPGGAVGAVTDLRSQTLGIALWAWNESFQETTCPASTRIAVDIPRGPILGGFSQSAPGRFGIDSHAVAGPSGSARDTDVRVPYGVEVNVYGTAFDTTRELFADGVNRGFDVLTVLGVPAPPADPADLPAMPATGAFFERPLQALGGNRYAVQRTSPTPGGALMPGQSGDVVWYYALAVDATGNWDRAPEAENGSFAYYQPAFDFCSVVPEAPVLTLASATAGGALLTWTEPTRYEGGLAVAPGDTLTYDVYVKTAGGDPWPSTPEAADLAGLSWTHAADLLAGTYYYMVVAKNSCAAAPQVSAPSNVVMECVGGSGVDCSLFQVPATARYGDPIRLSASGFCEYRGNGIADAVVFRVAGDATTDFPAAETGDEGAFEKTVTAVWSGGGGDAVVATGGTLGVELLVEGTVACPAATVALTGGECLTTPNPPTSLSAVRGARGSGAAELTWFRPNYNTDGTPLADLAGYEVESARCADFDSGRGTCRSWAAWAGTEVGDPDAQSFTWSGFVIGERYKFRLRAKDGCAAPNVSAWTDETALVAIR